MRFDPSLRDALARPKEALSELDRLDSEESLAKFFRRSWHVIEPGVPYVHGWHLDALAEHLEAVTSGQIIRLLINVPPGTMKSMGVSVLWPAWEWGPKGLRHYRYVGASHRVELAIRDNLRMRRMIRSEWYSQKWPIPLADDQDAKGKFENVYTGFRAAVAVTGITGDRGDRVIYDDPHSAIGALSDVQRQEVITGFAEGVTTRMNNPEKSAIVVIMQRLHEDDVSGHILSQDLGYEHLCYTSDTEVLTRSGWKLFADIKETDEVLAVEPDTLNASWQQPTSMVRYRYNGPIHYYRSSVLDLAVTPDHRMVYKSDSEWKVDRRSGWHVRPAAQLPRRFYVPQAVVWQGSSAPITYGGAAWDPSVFAEFMGWYLSSLGDSLTKRIPQEIKELPPTCLQKFLIAYAKGDGHFAVRNPRKVTISSRSRLMIDDLHECAIKAGWAASVSRCDYAGREIFNGHPRPSGTVWKLYIRASKARGEERKWYAKVRPENTSIEEYDGEVHCVSVPATALVVRRNGRAAVSGNCLPMRFESDRRCVTSIGFKDPRTEDGELLFPERFPEHVVVRDEKAMGTLAAAGQFQQRPTPRGGGMFPIDKFNIVDVVPAASEIVFSIRYWDKAGTDGTKGAKTGAQTAGVLMHKLKDGRFFIADCHFGRWAALERERQIKMIATADGKTPKIYVEQEPGSGGKESAEATIRNLAGWQVFADLPTGDKEVRAGPYAAQVQGGNVWLLKADWNLPFLHEHQAFPVGKTKDMVDASAAAFNLLAGTKSQAVARVPMIGLYG